MDKYTVAYFIQLEHCPEIKNKWYPDTHNINEIQKHCPKQEKPNAKEYILYDTICMTFYKRQTHL